MTPAFAMPQVHTVFTDRTRPVRAAILSALAGGATLMGEVLGARLLRPALGSTAVAQAGAVAGVLGGLGFGALWAGRFLAGGRVSARTLAQRGLLALLALTLAAPFVSAWTTARSARLLVALAFHGQLAADLVRLALALLACVPFGVVSGALYPALVVLHGRGAGRATAVTGAASSIGSAIAVLFATFALAPAFGVRAGLWLAASFYAVAFVGTFSFAPDAAEPSATTARDTARPARALLAILAVGGLGSVALQLAWTRLAVLAYGPSAFALAACTAAYTLALGAGEALAAPWVDRIRAPRRALGVTLAVAACAGLLSTRLGAHLPAWSGARLAEHVPSTGSLWMGTFALLFALVVPVIAPVAVGMGLTARLLGDSGLSRARSNAWTLGAMSVGNVVGALLAALVAIPTLAIAGTMVVVASAFAAAASAALWPTLRSRRMEVLVAALVVMAVGARLATRGWDDASLTRGPFLYAGAEDLDLGRIVRVSYGREATVAVRRDETGEVLLQIDGKIDATSGGDNATQTMVSLYPALLSSHPRRVLVVGLGSGMTVDAVRDVPGVERVDVTELLPEVIDAAQREFRAANHGALSRPGVRTLRIDASLFVRGTGEQYDVIVSEPSNPWVAGMADLFTVEALTAARARLAPAGVLSAWFHAYSTDAPTFAGVLATFRSVFPRAALVEMVPGQDYMFLGMVPPVDVDVDRVSAAIADPRVATQLARAGIRSRGEFFGRFIAGADGLDAMTRDADVFHADDLRLEFRAPALLYNDASTDIFALIARSQDEPLAGLSPHGAGYLAAIEESEPPREAGLHARQMSAALQVRDLDTGIFEGEQAVAANPSDASVRTQLAKAYLRRARRRSLRRDAGGAESDVRNALELHPGPAEQFRAHLVLGDMRLEFDDYAHAAVEYGDALEIARATAAPTPELHIRMAQVLVALGDLPHARDELDRAARECTDPARLEDIAIARGRIAQH